MTTSTKTKLVPRAKARWEHFPHDADVGIRGFGSTPAEAFEQAALAMTAVITNPAAVECREAIEVTCQARDLEFLFLDWLNALVLEMAQRRMLFGSFEVNIDRNRLCAVVRGEPVDVARHEPAAEIKGATLSELEVVREANALWRAQCIVDI